MTININLIAGRRAQRLRIAKLARFSAYGVVGLVVALIMVYAWLSIAVTMLTGEIREVEAKLNSPQLVRALNRITFLESQASVLRPRVKLLQQVQQSQKDWGQVLQDLSDVIPNDVWLTSVASRREQEEQKLIIGGSALSQAAVGNFMLNLKAARWCGLPALGYTQTVRLQGTPVVNFEVTVPLQKPIGSEIQ
jgi:Tfp pilus assembly protein PilN